jgi:hypothetical protein
MVVVAADSVRLWSRSRLGDRILDRPLNESWPPDAGTPLLDQCSGRV